MKAPHAEGVEIPTNPTMSILRHDPGAVEPGLSVSSPPPLAETLPEASPAAGADSAPSPATPAPVAGFELLHLVGRGGMGEVYAGVQRSLGRTVAIKRVRPVSGDNDGAREARAKLFRQEAITAARLEHPNIVPVHDLGAAPDGSPLLAMKLVEGAPWSRLLGENFDPNRFEDYLARHLPILISMAQAVAYAHSRGIVHRDLKPGQVMVGEFGEVLLMDWGLAVYVGEEPARSRGDLPPMLTRETASNPSGTPALMAPEQTESTSARIGPWTDVYLLGGTLYFILTGSFPHDGATGAAAMERARSGIVEPPSVREPSIAIPQELERLCLACLRPQPEDRLPSAAAFVDGLRDYLSGAGRRRQSGALTKAIGERLAQGGLAYADYAEGLVKIADARALWPGNAEADTLREAYHEGYARAALARGDRTLARTQALGLREGAAREDLLRDVDRADAANHRRERQRRSAIAAVLVLSLAAGGLGLWANAQRSRAETARRRAEDLMGFMLGDLHDGLRSVGRSKLLRPAALKAKEYYDTLPVSESDAAATVKHAQALLNLGDAFRLTGDNAERRELIDRAGRLLDAVPANDRESPEYRRVRGAQLFRDAVRLEEADYESDIGKIVAALRAAEEYTRRSAELAKDDPAAHRAHLEIVDYLIRYLVRSPERTGHEEALALAEYGLETRRHWSERLPEDYYWARNVCVSLERKRAALFALGRPGEGRAVADEEIEERRRLVDRFPTSVQARTEYAMIRAYNERRDAGRFASPRFPDRFAALRDFFQLLDSPDGDVGYYATFVELGLAAAQEELGGPKGAVPLEILEWTEKIANRIAPEAQTPARRLEVRVLVSGYRTKALYLEGNCAGALAESARAIALASEYLEAQRSREVEASRIYANSIRTFALHDCGADREELFRHSRTAWKQLREYGERYPSDEERSLVARLDEMGRYGRFAADKGDTEYTLLAAGNARDYAREMLEASDYRFAPALSEYFFFTEKLLTANRAAGNAEAIQQLLGESIDMIATICQANGDGNPAGEHLLTDCSVFLSGFTGHLPMDVATGLICDTLPLWLDAATRLPKANRNQTLRAREAYLRLLCGDEAGALPLHDELYEEGYRDPDFLFYYEQIMEKRSREQ